MKDKNDTVEDSYRWPRLQKYYWEWFDRTVVRLKGFFEEADFALSFSIGIVLLPRYQSSTVFLALLVRDVQKWLLIAVKIGL